jgi:hypothetical protein
MYMAVLFRPLMPLFLFELNQSYIAANLCKLRETKGNHCNGRCVLGNQLRAMEEKPGNNLPQQVLEEELVFTVVDESLDLAPSIGTHKSYRLADLQIRPQHVMKCDTPPPWRA